MLLRLFANGPFFIYVDKKTDEVGRWQLKCHQFAIMSSTEITQKGEGSQKTPNLDYVIYGWSLTLSIILMFYLCQRLGDADFLYFDINFKLTAV